MKLSTVIDRILYYISVPRCVSCDEALDFGVYGLCPKCMDELYETASRNCSVCSKLLSECSCSNSYLEKNYVKKVIKVFRYKNKEDRCAANDLIYSLKKDNRADVVKRCASILEKSVKNSLDDPSKYIITNVPRRRKAKLEIGYDHAELLAKELAKRLGAEYLPLLKSTSKREQKKLIGKARIKNVKVEIKNKADIKGKRIIIVDDIITSGASVAACATKLRSIGADETVAAALAIAYMDKYTPPAF